VVEVKTPPLTPSPPSTPSDEKTVTGWRCHIKCNQPNFDDPATG
jgi:hypothetical protein